ncbi:MAG: hypothetical protein IJK13_01100 [Lachnospiraceae bacterium]|nr:hypothetical protein [Lachnospiraceae bacterium]
MGNKQVAKKVAFLILVLCLILTGCSNYTNNDIDDRAIKEEQFKRAIYEADEGLDWAKNNGMVVFESVHCTSGKDIWDSFYDSVSNGEAASVICANYYTLDAKNVNPETFEQEKDNYPKLFFTIIIYDGNEFWTRTRLSTENELDSDVRYKYILHFTGEEKNIHYEEYVLVNDSSITREQLLQSSYSSQSTDWIESATVYRDWSNK